MLPNGETLSTRILLQQKKRLRLYSPYHAQRAFHNDPHRFRVVAWGRQTGKSTACVNEVLFKAWSRPRTRYWFIMPTFDQALGMYRRAVGMLWNCKEVMQKKNQTQLRVKLINHSEVVFKSGEVFDNLRSETLHGVIIDEVRDQNPKLWSMVIRPMLGTTGGWASFISTPRGFDHFYDLAQFAQKDTSNEWSYMHVPATQCPLWKPEEIDSIKRTMSEAEFAQEMLAEFRDLTAGRAYYGYSQENLLDHTPFPTNDLEQRVSDKLPIVVGCDFNLTPMSWVLGQFDKSKWYFFDEIFLPDSNTQEASRVLVEKLVSLKARGLLRAQPNVIICGDATGKAGQRAAAGQSDYDILLGMLKANGITYDNATPNANPIVKDRVNTINAKLKPLSGSPTLFFSPKNCPNLKKDWERVVWKAPGVLDKSKDPLLTHISDAAGYAVHALDPIKSILDVGIPRVIIR